LIERRLHSSVLDVRSFRAAELRERLAVRKQNNTRVDMDRWRIRSSIVLISDRFAALENLDNEVDVNKAWKTIRQKNAVFWDMAPCRYYVN
jgi:hypothetical protein